MEPIRKFKISNKNRIPPTKRKAPGLYKITGIIMVLFIFFNSGANGQTYYFQNFNVDNGLPQSQVRDIFQDHNGEIWFGTSGGGACNYDGANFQSYSTREGLNSPQAHSFYERPNGEIWIGTSNGLNTLKNGKISSLGSQLLEEKVIYCITPFKNGEVWIGTGKGVYVFRNEKFYEFELNDSIGISQVWSILEDKNGNAWISTFGNGIFVYGPTLYKHFLFGEKGCDSNKVLTINLVNGRHWIGTISGVFITNPADYPNLKFQHLYARDFAAFRILEDSRKNIWIATSGGAFRIFPDGKSKWYREKNGIIHDRLNSVMEDREGNIWFGSGQGGASKFINEMFTGLGEKDSVCGNSIMSIYPDSKGMVWLGGWGSGVNQFDYNKWRNSGIISSRNFSIKEGLGYKNGWGLTEDHSGNIWISTKSCGMSVFDGKKIRLYLKKDGLGGLVSRNVLCDKKGNIWIGHEAGLDKYDGNSFDHFNDSSGFLTTDISCIREDHSGILWIGCSQGLFSYDGKRFFRHGKEEDVKKIRTIAEDKFGNIWFNYDKGVMSYDRKRFSGISENEGLSSSMVYLIQPDKMGNIWFGMNNGVDRLNLNLFQKQKKIEIQHFGKDEGFVGVETNANASCITNDGNIWFGTILGTTIFNPTEFTRNKIEPLTRLKNIKLFFENADFGRYCDSTLNNLPVNLTLPYDKNHLTFEFIGISLRNSKKVKYSFMLDGFDNTWSPEVSDHKTTYSNLPPGSYIFKLKACNDDLLWNKTPVEFSFTITPPFWKTLWFQFLLISMIGGVVFSYIKWRERKLRKDKTVLEGIVKQRTMELSEEKEKLLDANLMINERNKNITDSIHYAERIQKAILPDEQTIRRLLPESFILYKPKDIVSGDFYWMEEIDGKVILAIVDCTGHGVPGAFMSMIGNDLLNHIVLEKRITSPALILEQMDLGIRSALKQDSEAGDAQEDGMDAAICVIDKSSETLVFSGANRPLIKINSDGAIEFSPTKRPIGGIGESGKPFSNVRIQYKSSDVFYAYSDGYFDQFGGADGKKFRNKKLLELLFKIHAETFPNQKKILDDTYTEWKGKLPQIDDVMIAGFRIS